MHVRHAEVRSRPDRRPTRQRRVAGTADAAGTAEWPAQRVRAGHQGLLHSVASAFHHRNAFGPYGGATDPTVHTELCS